MQGNERVVRPRLADARFFFETDKKTKLADRVPQLGSIVYHNKLGTQLERVERLRRLATRIQAMLPRGAVGMPYADRAALLAKADLVTLMVGEFPELQGIMGKYYAEADGEEPSVVRAIEQHYWPRFAGDQLPVGDVSIAVALADKLDTLVGLFGIGAGSPPATRIRSACAAPRWACVRILVEKAGLSALDLDALLNEAFARFPDGQARGDAHADRARLHPRAPARDTCARRATAPTRSRRCSAENPVRLQRGAAPARGGDARSRALPESESLAAANKRIAEHPAAGRGRRARTFANVERAELPEAAELALYDALTGATKSRGAALRAGRLHRVPAQLRDPQGAGRRVLRQGAW